MCQVVNKLYVLHKTVIYLQMNLHSRTKATNWLRPSFLYFYQLSTIICCFTFHNFSRRISLYHFYPTDTFLLVKNKIVRCYHRGAEAQFG